MLAYLLNFNSFFSDVYMDNLADKKCQLHHLHLYKYFIQQTHDKNLQYLCYYYCVYTSVDIYLLGQENCQH